MHSLPTKYQPKNAKKDPYLKSDLCCYSCTSRLKQWNHLRDKSIKDWASVPPSIKHRRPLITPGQPAHSAEQLHLRRETQREWKCSMCVRSAMSDTARFDDTRVLVEISCVSARPRLSVLCESGRWPTIPGHWCKMATSTTACSDTDWW